MHLYRKGNFLFSENQVTNARVQRADNHLFIIVDLCKGSLEQRIQTQSTTLITLNASFARRNKARIAAFRGGNERGNFAEFTFP